MAPGITPLTVVGIAATIVSLVYVSGHVLLVVSATFVLVYVFWLLVLLLLAIISVWLVAVDMAAAGDSKQQAAERGAVFQPLRPLTIPYVASPLVLTPELERALAAAEAAYLAAHPPRAQPRSSRYADLEADADDKTDDAVPPPTVADVAFIDDTPVSPPSTPPPNPYLTPPRNTGYASPVHDSENTIAPAQPVRMYHPTSSFRCLHCAVITRAYDEWESHHTACPALGNSHN